MWTFKPRVLPSILPLRAYTLGSVIPSSARLFATPEGVMEARESWGSEAPGTPLPTPLPAEWYEVSERVQLMTVTT